MELLDIYSIMGRNIYSHKPITKMIIKLSPQEITETKNYPRFNSNLLALLPGLKEHRCSRGYPGGFAERLTEGTYLPHVIEHVALELQALLGYDVNFGKARSIGDGIYYIIFSCQSSIAGEGVGMLAFNIVQRLLKGQIPEVQKEVNKLSNKISKESLGPSTQAILDYAISRKIPVNITGIGSIAILGYGKYSKKVQASITGETSNIAVDISCDKMATKKILSQIGLPVPEGMVSQSEEEAVNWAKKLGAPVVLKPLDSNQGKGVTLNLIEGKEIRSAFRIAKNFSEKVLVERYIQGKHYRVLVINGKVEGASERIPPFVVGDGKRTIKELIDLINMDKQRGDGHEKPLTKIVIDPVIHMVLAKYNMTLNYIPSLGEKIFLRENANLSTGGIAIDVTDNIHPTNKDICIMAAESIGLDVAGVDLVVEDISKPITEQSGAIIEVNAAPGLRMHLYPSKGERREVGKSIVDYLFPVGQPFTIPIVSVTGTNGKTTTVKLISHILHTMGYNITSTTTDGIMLNGKLLKKGDFTGPEGSRAALLNPLSEGGVLEIARGGLIRNGLGYDLSDVSVVTNINEDHLGENGINTLEDLAWVKSLVVEATKEDGKVVLNADDPLVSNMANKARCEVVYFSMRPDNSIITSHIKKGGAAVYVFENNIVYSVNNSTKFLAKINEIPITYNGKAQHNIANSLAAAAAAISLGISPKKVAEGLKTFENNRHNPGRINFFDMGRFTVVVDYGHNGPGYKAVLEFMKDIKKTRLIGIIGVPGDRKDEYILKTGQVAGEYLDEIIIKEDQDLRGRKRGEVANLLALSLPKRIPFKIILNECEALEYAMDRAKDGDIIIIFYEKLEPVIKVIEKYKEQKKLETTGVTAG